MLTDQNFKKQDVMIGESMFYDPKYDVNADSAFYFREHNVHECYRFHYVFEPMNNGESEESKRHRFGRLRAIGCQLLDTFVTPAAYPEPKLLLAARTMRVVCCPYLRSNLDTKSTRSLLAISVRWYHVAPAKVNHSSLAEFLNSLAI